MVNFNQIKQAINQSNIISFDLFDTLVKRDCYKPKELFYFVEKKINQEFGIESHYAALRVEAEKNARINIAAEEISLTEIYAELSLKISDENKKKIKQWEEEYEYTLCQWNPFMKPVYEYCRTQGKKIFIVTDIYLPESLIQKILDKLGISYNALFVSSTMRKTKNSGSLFREVLKRVSVEPRQILHIGDNKKSDYIIPKKMGIQAFHIPKDLKLNLFVDKQQNKKNPWYADLCSFINNHADNHDWDAIHVNNSFDFFSEAGYEIQGPVLYGYVKWLQKQFKSDAIEKVFFLARDGQLMQQAYRKLSDTLPNTYMYASRKALIIPSLWMTPSIPQIREAIFWGRRGNIRSFLKKIGMVPNEFEKDFATASLSLDTVFEYENLWQKPEFIHVFETKVKQKMIAHSRKMYELLLQYLKQIDFHGKIAVVDIGWYGHMQDSLIKIVEAAKIPVDIHGFYLGIRPESPILKDIQAKGYLFDSSHDRELSRKEMPFNAIVETLFTANHGSTLKYEVADGCIVPVLDQWEYNNPAYKGDYKAIRSCQNGALTFIDDVLKEQKHFLLDLNPSVTFINWIQLGLYPSVKAAELFGNLHFMDDSIKYLAKPKGEKSFYLIHPQLFLNDFRNAFWSRGFLIYILGDSIPYASMYEIAKKVYYFLRKII